MTTPIKRKPAPTPAITIQNDCFDTPESVRIRRMKFEVEFRTGSPRRRAMSANVGDESPSRKGVSPGLLSTRESYRRVPDTEVEAVQVIFLLQLRLLQ
jgi:hypothetical protein